MRIEEYKFHQKFHDLIKWCRPDIRYTLSKKAWNYYNDIRIDRGYTRIAIDARSKFWFRFTDHCLEGPYNRKDTKTMFNETNLAHFIFTCTHISTTTLTLAWIMLDTENLEPA